MSGPRFHLGLIACDSIALRKPSLPTVAPDLSVKTATIRKPTHRDAELVLASAHCVVPSFSFLFPLGSMPLAIPTRHRKRNAWSVDGFVFHAVRHQANGSTLPGEYRTIPDHGCGLWSERGRPHG